MIGEHKLMMFENGVLRKIFGPKRDEVTGGWRKLHMRELHNFHIHGGEVQTVQKEITWKTWTGFIWLRIQTSSWGWRVAVNMEVNTGVL
jgi:hypothetical protein